MKATNSTEGEMNSPMKVTAKNRKLTKDQGPLRAMALVMKVTVQRRTKWVLDSGYTSMKVKSRKATVVFPKVPFRVFPKPKWGRKPKRKMVIRLGQSMEMVIHIIREVRKIPSTANPSWVRGAGAGSSLTANPAARERISHNRSFCDFVMFSPYSFRRIWKSWLSLDSWNMSFCILVSLRSPKMVRSNVTVFSGLLKWSSSIYCIL